MPNIPGAEFEVLTAEAIERAHSGVSDNPIITILGRHVDLMHDYNPDTYEARDAYVDDLIEYSPFELDIETLIATWALGFEDTSSSGMSHTFSVPLFAVHALYAPAINPKSRDITQGFIRESALPDSFYEHTEHLEFARRRKSEISTELRRLTQYLHGVEDPMVLANTLARSDNPEDQARLDEFIRRGKERKTPLLTNFGENITNARLHLSMMIETTLDS